MPVVSAQRMLTEAATHGYAVGAFNVTNIIQMAAVIEAAAARRAPLIVQTSVTPTKFLRPEVIADLYDSRSNRATGLGFLRGSGRGRNSGRTPHWQFL